MIVISCCATTELMEYTWEWRRIFPPKSVHCFYDKKLQSLLSHKWYLLFHHWNMNDVLLKPLKLFGKCCQFLSNNYLLLLHLNSRLLYYSTAHAHYSIHSEKIDFNYELPKTSTNENMKFAGAWRHIVK